MQPSSTYTTTQCYYSLKEEDVVAYAAEHPYHVIDSSLSNYSKVGMLSGGVCTRQYRYDCL